MADNLEESKDYSRKEFFYLWREYIKRGEGFKLFCQLMNDLRKSPKENHFTVYCRVEKKFMSLAKDKREKKEFYNECYIMLVAWESFGDVYNLPFEEWWAKNPILSQKYSVIDIADRYERTPDRYFPNVLKLAECEEEGDIRKLFDHMSHDPVYMYLAVPIFGNTNMKEISEQISAIREKRQSDLMAQAYDLYMIKKYQEPSGRVRFDELKRYLEVYDMKKQGLKMSAIAEHYNKDPRDVYELRKLYTDLKKAKQIIDNAILGYFPNQPKNKEIFLKITDLFPKLPNTQ